MEITKSSARFVTKGGGESKFAQKCVTSFMNGSLNDFHLSVTRITIPEKTCSAYTHFHVNPFHKFSNI